MPRRRKSSDQPVKRRTRTGCQTCRQRKIKCDEVTPNCNQCLEKNLRCVTWTPLKWEAEYLSQGLAFGRAGVWTKHSKTPHSPLSDLQQDNNQNIWCPVPHIFAYSFVNATIGSIENLTTLGDIGIENDHDPSVTTPEVLRDASSDDGLSPWLMQRRLARSENVISTTISPWSQVQTPTENVLLSYYLNKLCPLTMPTSSSISPFATLIIPFSMSSSSLVLDSCLALAACHRSRQELNFKSTALQLSNKALHGLRERLKYDNPQIVALNPETLIIMLMLCLFEIVNECDERWVVHLKGARDLIRIRRGASAMAKQNESSNELVLFAERFFAYQDVIGRTACGEDPIFGADFWASDSRECDAWLGCSTELVSILCETTELSRQRRTYMGTGRVETFQIHAASLETRLELLDQKIYNADDIVLGTSAELKRIAAELYLQCSLHNAHPAMSMVQDYICRIFQLLSILLHYQALAGLTWPLFVAAVELDPAQDLKWKGEDAAGPDFARPFVMFALARMAGSMANLRRTRTVIEQVWQARELASVSETLSELSESALDGDVNDWERFVAPFCGNMSLA